MSTVGTWTANQLKDMFPDKEKHVVYGALYGEYGNPWSFSSKVKGHRDKITKNNDTFVYTLHDSDIFTAHKNTYPQCVDKMRVSYVFKPCWCSKLTQERLNMLAFILDVPVRFHMDDGDDEFLYSDGMLCDSVQVFPGVRKVLYYVHPINSKPYIIVRSYDKKGEWIL